MTSSESSAKILIVEDNKENVDLLVYFLKPQNYLLEIAHDGVEAMEKIEKEPPDIILLDIMLPRMDGFELCERVKKDPATMFIPVIMITALKDLKDKMRSLEVGADDFITKPFENVELLTRVKSLLRIKKYHDELEKKNTELADKNKELIQMDQFKEELVHLIVHDMKNPLFVIQGNLQMMSMGLEQSASDMLKKYVGRIDRSAQNLLRMVTNLIDISKIEQGTMQLNLEVTNLNEVLEKTITKYREYPEYREKVIQTDFTGGLPMVHIDRSVMEQVFDNLLSFSIPNVPNDGKIEIHTAMDGDQVMVSIHDFGVQIPHKYKNQLFDKFSQVQIKDEGYRLSRALGFTFSRLAAEAHGGSLVLDDQNQVGNRFVLKIKSRPQTPGIK
jgi:K+-sensing histidine kinase KdpD